MHIVSTYIYGYLKCFMFFLKFSPTTLIITYSIVSAVNENCIKDLNLFQKLFNCRSQLIMKSLLHIFYFCFIGKSISFKSEVLAKTYRSLIRTKCDLLFKFMHISILSSLGPGPSPISISKLKKGPDLKSNLI